MGATRVRPPAGFRPALEPLDDRSVPALWGGALAAQWSDPPVPPAVAQGPVVFVIAAIGEFFRLIGFVLSVPLEPHIHRFLTGLSAASEQKAEKLADIKGDQSGDAVRPELRSLRLPDRRLSPHTSLQPYQLSSGFCLPAARPKVRATVKVTA